MNSKERYKELIKENNETIKYLSNSYQSIAYTYIKKARGYAIKSLDTEVKIKKVLEELSNFDEKHIDVHLAIPNMSIYIESHVQYLSKAVANKYKVKEIIAVTIFLLILVGYFVANFYLNKKVPLSTPTNVNIAVMPNQNNCFYLTWDHNELATNGYYLIIYEDDEKIKEVDVKKQVDTNTNKQYFKTDIVYKDGKRYKFEIKTEATNEYKASDIVIIYYPN